MPRALGSEAGPAGSTLQTLTSIPQKPPREGSLRHIKPSSSNPKSKSKLVSPDSLQMGKLRLRNLHKVTVCGKDERKGWISLHQDNTSGAQHVYPIPSPPLYPPASF